jgi:hypothetical protein
MRVSEVFSMGGCGGGYGGGGGHGYSGHGGYDGGHNYSSSYSRGGGGHDGGDGRFHRGRRDRDHLISVRVDRLLGLNVL